MKHTENLRTTMLETVAAELAELAANTLEPHAGQPIDAEARQRLADGVLLALRQNVPTLMNIRHALDMS